MKHYFAFAVLLNALLACHFCHAGEPSQKPNIVLVFTDDLGIEALKAYGGHGVKTPHIDKLASNGMLFTHCLPARPHSVQGRTLDRHLSEFHRFPACSRQVGG